MEPISAEATAAFEEVRKELITDLQALSAKLEKIYSSEFLRLTDLEEDWKWDSHKEVQEIFNKIDPVIVEYKINVAKAKLPDWLDELKQAISAGSADKPRSCFQIIGEALAALG